MNKKTKIITMFLLMVFFIQTLAFAEIPVFTVVIGNKGYSLKQLHQGEGNPEIEKGVPVYIKNGEGKWIDTQSGKKVDKNSIPEVTYFDEYGNKVVYEKHDGDIIEEESEKMYFELFITKNTSGIGQVIKLNMTAEGYSEFFNASYFQIVDKENNNITQMLELGKENFIYPEIKAEKVNIILYDFSKEKIGGIEAITIKEDGKILISERKIAENEVITVSTSEELIAAFGSRRIIRLKKGKYDLLNYEKKSSSVSYDEVYEGLEIILNNIVDLTIEGEDGVELYVDPRQATVMNFKSCSKINLKNLTIGHSREKGACTGGVLKFDYCQKINIENCVLYGCGTEGLTITGTRDVNVIDSVIEECSYGIMSLDNSSNICFEKSTFRNNKDDHGVVIFKSNNIKFNECIFQNNAARFVELISGKGKSEGEVTIENCIFTKNGFRGFIDENYKKNVVLKNNKFEQNKFGNEKVALLVAGSVNDKCFNESALSGIEVAKNKYNINYKVVEVDNIINEEKEAVEVIEESELIIGIGFMFQEVIDSYADKYPEKSFVLIDAVSEKENVTSLVFDEEKGAFLLGTLAGLETESKKVGFIGGMEMPLITKYYAAFTAGVYTTNKEAGELLLNKKTVEYTGTFSEADKGFEAANSLYSEGCDYIINVNGACEIGAYKFGEQLNKKSTLKFLGVDCAKKEQYPEYSDIIECSMEKSIGRAVEYAIKNYKTSSLPKGTKNLGIQERCVLLSKAFYMINNDEKEKVIDMRDEIVEGKIIVPKTEEELKDYIEKLQ